jgi:hypothetical protein
MTTAMPTTPAGEPLDVVLARETGLAPAQVTALVAEYQRFLRVDAEMGGAAEPPAPLEQVRGWHLTGAEGRVTPETPAYAATLARYRTVFGIDPPGEIWPGLAQKAEWRRGGRMVLWSIGLGVFTFFASILSDHWIWAIGQGAAMVGFFWGLGVWLRKRPVSVARPSQANAADEAFHHHAQMVALNMHRNDP